MGIPLVIIHLQIDFPLETIQLLGYPNLWETPMLMFRCPAPGVWMLPVARSWAPIDQQERNGHQDDVNGHTSAPPKKSEILGILWYLVTTSHLKRHPWPISQRQKVFWNYWSDKVLETIGVRVFLTISPKRTPRHSCRVAKGQSRALTKGQLRHWGLEFSHLWLDLWPGLKSSGQVGM